MDDVELIESATSAMRATTQKLFEAKCHEPFATLSCSDIQQMVEFGATNPEANISEMLKAKMYCFLLTIFSALHKLAQKCQLYLVVFLQL